MVIAGKGSSDQSDDGEKRKRTNTIIGKSIGMCAIADDK